MSVFSWLRNKLWLDNINREIGCLDYQNKQLHTEVTVLRDQLKTTNLALGRIVAKLDPNYGQDYNDPNVQAESDKLGRRAIDTLIAEENARRHTEGRAPMTPDELNYIQR